MTKKLTALGLAAALSVAPLPALAQDGAAPLSVGDELGTTLLSVLTGLIEAGYEVEEIELDDDEIEADARFSGRWYDIEVSTQTGLIVDIDEKD